MPLVRREAEPKGLVIRVAPRTKPDEDLDEEPEVPDEELEDDDDDEDGYDDEGPLFDPDEAGR